MIQDFEKHEQAHSFDKRRDGFVHTAEINVRWRQGIDLETLRGNKQSITKWHGSANKDGNTATFRFNPNNERVCSPYSGNMVKLGNCPSLADFENVLTATANRAGFARDDLDIMRVDFAVDHYGEEGADYFRKLCDLLIAAFIVKHDIPPKDQHWSETTITREPKSNKATWGAFTFERYNKAIQQPEHGATWRFELRYSRDKKHPDKEQPTEVKEMLEALIEELNSLPKFYTAAQKQMNEALLAQYDRLRSESRDDIRVYQFLQMSNDRIFSRAQVRQFFVGLGLDKSECQDKANTFSRKKGHLYISKQQFESFTECLAFSMKTWYENTPSFDEFLKN